MTVVPMAERHLAALAEIEKTCFHAPWSEKMLRDKLTAKNFPQEGIDYAVERLTELGALNDGEYARMVARYYVDRGFGRQKVDQELRRRGISQEIAQEILPGLAPCSRQVVAYLEKTIRGHYTDKRLLRKAAAGLYRRGFSWEQINTAIDVYCDPQLREEQETAADREE